MKDAALSIKKKNILLIVPEMATRGGIQSYMLRLWEMLNDLKGVQLRCASLNDSNDALAQRVPAAAGRLRGYSRNKLAFVLGLLSGKRSDTLAIVGHLHLAPVALAAKLLGLTQGYIVILHGIEAWKRSGWLIRLAMRQAISNVATTHYTATLNARLNDIHDSQYHVIPLCAERDIPPPTPGFQLKGQFPFLMVARLDASEKYKGMEMVIDAVARLQETSVPAHFNLVGDGNDRKRLEEYAAEKGCSQHVTFWGSLSDNDMQAAYQSAAVFIMPSKEEGFGIVFLEAMRHGVPCIGGNHGGTPEVIKDGGNGYLVEWGDIDGLTTRMALLWQDQALRANLGKAAAQTYADQYTFSAFSLNWRKLIAHE